MRDQLLPAAALARDQYRRLSRRNLLDHFEQSAERAALADDLAEIEFRHGREYLFPFIDSGKDLQIGWSARPGKLQTVGGGEQFGGGAEMPERGFKLLALDAGGNAEILHRLGDLRTTQLKKLTVDSVDLRSFDFKSDFEGFL